MSERKKAKVKKVERDSKYGGVKYICLSCDKEFSAKASAKYCSDPCRVKGPKLTTAVSTGGRVAHHGPKALAEEIEEYFSIKDKDQITPAGLLLFLGISRQMWEVYEQKPNLKRICDMARLKMEHYGTRRLYTNGRVADIFFMKNMGWSDKKEVEKKEHLIISNSINDEQAEQILDRVAKRRRLMEGKKGGASTSS